MHTMKNSIKKIIVGSVLTLIGAMAPMTAFAIAENFAFVYEQTNPVDSNTYAFGSVITVTGSWQMPPDWIANIYVVNDGITVASTTISNLFGVATTTGALNLPIGVQADGQHTIKLEVTAGERCATEVPQTCQRTPENFIPLQIYPSRVYTVSVPPFPRLEVCAVQFSVADGKCPVPYTPPAMNFANVQTGLSEVRDIYLRNTGGQTLQGSASGLTNPFFVVSGGAFSPSYILAPTQQKTIRVQFVPTVEDSYDQTITFSCIPGSTNPCLPVSVTRQIIGNSVGDPVPPQVGVSTNALDFLSVNVGATPAAYRDLTFTVSNIGGGLLNGIVDTGNPNYVCMSGCNYSLLAGSSAVVTLRFSPLSGGTIPGVATLTGGSGASINLTGFGNTTPLLRVCKSGTATCLNGGAPGTLLWTIAGLVNVGDERFQSYTIQNIGGGSLSGALTGLPANDFECTTVPCDYTGLTNSPASFKIIQVRFSPTVAGIRSTVATFTNNDGQPVTTTMSGTGNTSPVSSVGSGVLVTFPNAIVGGAPTIGTLTFSNVGLGTLSGSVGGITGTNALGMGVFTCTSNCNYDLAPGESTTIQFQFLPSGAGTANAAATLPGLGTVNFRGVGISPSIRVEIYDPQTFTWYAATEGMSISTGVSTFMNPGDQQFLLYMRVWNGGSGGSITFTNVYDPFIVCVSPGGFCAPNRTATVSPLSPNPSLISGWEELRIAAPDAGNYILPVTVNYDLGDGVPRSLNFSIVKDMVTQSVLNVSPGLFDLSATPVNVGSSVTRTLTITNVGTTTMNTTVTFNVPWLRCTAGCVVPPLRNSVLDGSHVVEFVFEPTAGIGYTDANAISVTSDGGNRNIAFVGIGSLKPAILVAPISFLDFPTTTMGQYTEKVITVENTGLGLLQAVITYQSALGGTNFKCFPVTTGCIVNLPAGESTTRTIRFSPLGIGDIYDTLRVEDANALNSPQTVALHGVGQFAPIISVGGSDTNFGEVVVGQYKDKVIPVRNSGTVDFTGGVLNISGPYRCISPLDPSDGLCHYNLLAGVTQNFTIRFRPPAVGLFLGTVTLSGVPFANFSIQGEGVSPILKVIER